MGCTDVSTGNAHSSISEIEITIETTTAAAPTFIGGSSKIKKSYGRTVTINSATANYICYDDTNDPVCNATSLTCSIGTMIAGTTGETVGITSSVTMKAIACGDGKGHLDSAVISQEVELVTKTVGDVTVDVTSLEDVDTQGKNITLSAVDADNICYYAHEEGESAEPTCGNDGTCTGEAKTISGDFGMVTIRKHNLSLIHI